MIVGERVRERMKAAGLSQAELARRVGMAQPSIFQLIHRGKKGSTKLHVIARELGTTPAYLSGETDDPHADAPPPPALDADERELFEHFGHLAPADRRALLQIARSMAGGGKPSDTVHDRDLPAHAGPKSEWPEAHFIPQTVIDSVKAGMKEVVARAPQPMSISDQIDDHLHPIEELSPEDAALGTADYLKSIAVSPVALDGTESILLGLATIEMPGSSPTISAISRAHVGGQRSGGDRTARSSRKIERDDA